MKTNIFLLVAVITLFSLSTFSQIAVDSNGRVAIKGTSPNPLFNVTVNGSTMFIPSSGVPVFIGWSSLEPVIYPGADNAGSIGLLNNQFRDVHAKYHYANGVLLTSDKRLKENFRTIDQPLNKLLQMNGQKYDFISQGTDTIKDVKEKQKQLRLEKNRLGFIAQDLEKILPDAIFYFKDEDRYYIDYNAIIPVIVEAMKEQQTIIQELKNNVASIEANCCSNSLKSASIPTGTTLTENKAQLDQNIPNPFSKETRIGCFIPEGSVTSMLYIYNMNGTQLQQYIINGLGKQSVTINGSSFDPGMYLYALVIDGREVDTKKMILTK